MEKEGYVSLWIGNALSNEILESYLELNYNSDGDWDVSAFMQDFKIDLDDFDEDFVECIFHDTQKHGINELLKRCSYEDVIVPRFIKKYVEKNKEQNNVAVLLYNFEYQGCVTECKREGCKLEFIGSVKYEK